MRQISILLLLLTVSAFGQIRSRVYECDQYDRVYSQAGHVWLYVIDGERVTVGSEAFATLVGGRSVEWDKAMQYMSVKVNPNGKYKIKLKKKNSATVLDYKNLDKKTLKELLKAGYLIVDDGGNVGGNEFRKEK